MTSYYLNDMYDVINVTLCHSKSKLNPQKKRTNRSLPYYLYSYSNPNSANKYPHQYFVLAKLNAFKSGVQDKLYETYKTDLSENRDFGNEILRWQTKWSHSTDEKPVTLTETVSSTLIRTFIRGHNYYHPPDNASVNCYPRTIL